MFYIRQDKSCGAVVFREKDDGFYFLLLKHTNGGHWGLPKGHPEGDETEEQTALREIYEESGKSVLFLPGFRHLTRYSPKLFVKKEVVYFLAKAKGKKLHLQKGEIDQGVWFKLEDALRLVTHSSTGEVLKKAQAFLQSSKIL